MDLESGLITAGVAAAVGGVMVADSRIQKWVQKNRTEDGNDVFKHVQTAGDAVFPVNAGLAVASYFFRDSEGGNKLFQTSLVSLEAQGLASGLTHLAKIAIGRKRPGEDPQGNSYSPGRIGSSLPSGHATNIFAFAAVFGDQYGPPAQALLYTLAVAVSAERVYRNHHFTSDVLAGAVIGYVVGKALALRHTYGDRGLSFMPLDVAGGVGITMQYRF
jgi:membrane-associated phospholipid phosphatase